MIWCKGNVGTSEKVQSEARQLFSGTTLGRGLCVNPAGHRKAGSFPGDQGGCRAGKEEKGVRIQSTGPYNAQPDWSGCCWP